MTILEFKPKCVAKETVSSLDTIPENPMLSFWNERNQIILDNFPTMSYQEKQNTIEAVIGMNCDLYKIVLELKAELYLMKGE